MHIPRKRLQDGIDLCKKNVLDYLAEARLISQKGSLHHAYVSVQLAIEETGKALCLRDELQKGSSESVEVPDIIFGRGGGGKSHWHKFKRASKELNQDLLWVCKGIFNRKLFSPKIFDVGREASPRTRLLNAYVDFDEKTQEWSIGCNIDESRLCDLTRNIEQVILTL